MNEILKTISNQDFWEIIAPLILSSVAIGVSIHSATKQNKIALFEKRFKVVYILSFLISVAKSVLSDTGTNKWLPLDTAMQSYVSTTTMPETITASDDFSSFYSGLILETSKIECLFKNTKTKHIKAFLNSLNNYISNCAAGKPTDKEKGDLEVTLKILEESKVLTKIDRCLKL